MESPQHVNLELVLVVGSFALLTLALAIILFIYLFQRKLIKRKLAFLKIEDLLKQQELKSAYALLEGQDIERQRIAQELHDDLGSTLVTLAMYADTVTQVQDTVARVAMIAQISNLSKQAVENIRSVSHRLDSSGLTHFGLTTAIHDLLDVVRQANTIQVRSHVSIHTELTREISFTVYRILQELINNTLKHAQATEISVEITQVKEEYISFIYADDGIGIPVGQPSPKGMGLHGIASRVEKVRGTLNLDTNHHFSAVIEIPLS